LMKKIMLLFLIIFIASCSPTETNLKLPAIFSDHMVMQQDTLVSVWGWAEPGTKIELNASWGVTAKARSGESGKWQMQISTPESGFGIGSISVAAGAEDLKIEDILFGEVWLCSGQSNMEMPLKGWPPHDPIDNSEEEIESADYQGIRMFTVQKAMSFSAVDDCIGTWKVCSPENAPEFSATAYFFGRELHQNLEVPVGLIHSSWGGTPAESWTHPDHIVDVPGYENLKEQYKDITEAYAWYKQWVESLDNLTIDPDSDHFFRDISIGDSHLSSLELDDSGWQTMPVPSAWEDHMGHFDGVVWFRKEFKFNGDIDRDNYILYLGTIDDMDVTYLNGEKIGAVEKEGFWQQERAYEVPKGLLKKGKNTVAVRVIDTRGGGGIYGTRKRGLMLNGVMVADLTGEWKYLPTAIISGKTMHLFGSEEMSYAQMPKMPVQLNPYAPTVLYNAMISPLVPYAIKGAIWYQGESNVGRAEQYRELFPAMIRSWRSQWNNVFPFYYVQIAPFNYNETEKGVTAELREAQLLTLKEESVGMVVTTDIGNPKNIHPGNKQEVGRRLALWARAKNYGVEGLVYSGPIYRSMKISESTAVISFDHTGSGLYCPDEELTLFEVAGADGVYYPANARIRGNEVLIKSGMVKIPVAVRFGWSDIAEPNLFNREGLPASPFRTIR
jgi:sialate O-acetylesterase